MPTNPVNTILVSIKDAWMYNREIPQNSPHNKDKSIKISSGIYNWGSAKFTLCKFNLS